MSSNLIKANYIYYDKADKRVIDSNSHNDFIKIPVVQKFQEDKNEMEGTPEFVEGLFATTLEAIEEPDEVAKKADEIITNANTEAARILDEAVVNANKEKENIFNQAKEEGYLAGYQAGQDKISAIKQEYEEKQVALEQAYEDKVKELEPSFVGLMIDYIKKLTGIVTTDHNEVMQHLIHNAIMGTERCNMYTIKVSKDDYNYVSSIQEELSELFKNEVKLDIVEDNSLEKNQCMIETDNRIIDCSLNVQLENLVTELKILALR